MILSANNACDGRKQFYAREAPKLGKKKKILVSNEEVTAGR